LPHPGVCSRDCVQNSEQTRWSNVFDAQTIAA
jgi:hypothetical protein